MDDRLNSRDDEKVTKSNGKRMNKKNTEHNTEEQMQAKLMRNGLRKMCAKIERHTQQNKILNRTKRCAHQQAVYNQRTEL